MADEELPGEIVVKARDKVRDDWRRDFKLRVPDADVGDGTQPWVDGSTAADALMPLYNDAQVIGAGTNLRTSSGKWLAEIGDGDGVSKRPAVGSTGFVTVSTSAGGWTIQKDTELRTRTGTAIRFKVRTTALYTDGSSVPISGIDTGPSTNLDAGVQLQFTSPPPGVGSIATITAQSDGSGLSGGHDADDDQAFRVLIKSQRSNPPAAGNDAEYQRAIQNVPGIAVEQAFTYPGILGPGTIAFCFTLRTSTAGASRAPNAAEIAAVLDYVIGQEPADDGVFGCTLLEQPVDVALSVTFGKGASSFVDATPWPPYVAADQVIVDGATTPTESSFQLTTGTTIVDPQIGQTIGFYDAAERTFRMKRIADVIVLVSGQSWLLTADTANNASDTSYTPTVGTAASPWSDSLQSLADPLIAYLATLGPGEQVVTLPDPGRRQRRQPESPGAWASVISSRDLEGSIPRSLASDLVLLSPAVPYTTPVGTPGVLSYLLVLGDLAVYQQ